MEHPWMKRTTLFLTGQTISLFGSAVVQYAISWHITLTTKSGLMMTVATLCGFLPQLLISLFAGVWADRFDRKKLIIISDSMIAICTAILAIFFALGFTELWLLFVISAIRSLGAGVQTPAVSAFLTELVPQDKLMRVNGINSSIQSVVMILSPLVAGALYGIVGLRYIFWVDVFTAIIGIAIMFILKVEKRTIEKIDTEEHFFQDMLSGINYVGKTKWLRQFLVFYLLLTILFGPVVFLTPLMVARSFGEEPWRLVTHEIVFSVGSIIGGLLAGFLDNKFKNKVTMVVLGCIGFGLTTTLMGFSPNFWIYLGIMFPMGIIMPFINTGSITVLQTKVKPELIGRVFGLVSIIGSAGMPLSMVIFGPLADVMSVEIQLIISGIIMILISLVSMRFKEMKQAGEPVLIE